MGSTAEWGIEGSKGEPEGRVKKKKIHTLNNTERN